MEDYSPAQGEVEETPAERRRFLRGNFLRSWLESRRDSGEYLGDETTTIGKKKRKKGEKEPEKSEADDEWRPERLRDRLRSIFNGLVGLELLPIKAEAETSQPSQEAPIDRSDTDIDNTAEQTSEEVEAEAGVLAVSPDAQRRYYGQELTTARQTSSNEQNPNSQPEIEVDDIETDHPVEKSAEMSTVESVDHAASEHSGLGVAATPVGEVLRKRQAERLERRVKRLKRETRTLQREQREFNDRQNKFAKELVERQKAEEKLRKVTIPKMEKARERLQSRIEKPPVKPEVIRGKTAVLERSPNQPVQVKTEYRPELKPEVRAGNTIVKPTPAETASNDYHAKLEQLLSPAELTGRPNDLNERLYERRHEVKDDASEPSLVTSKIPTMPVGSPAAPPLPPPLPLHLQTLIPSQPQQSPPPNPSLPSPQPGTDMYKYAMRMGFWGGLGVSVILLLVLMFIS